MTRESWLEKRIGLLLREIQASLLVKRSRGGPYMDLPRFCKVPTDELMRLEDWCADTLRPHAGGGNGS